MRWIAFAALVLLASLVATGVLVGTAALTCWPVVFLAVGWLAFALGILFAAKIALPRHVRWRYAIGVLGILSVVGCIALLWRATGMPPTAPRGTKWVTLPTGSRIADLRLAPEGRDHPTPLIFLHGGPAVADMAGDASYLRRLAANGYDVYLYDQLGAGRSSRLSDPSGYTLAREVADLEAFRVAIGAQQVDLLGYSWGGTLAAAYLAKHPGHVAKVVFISPGRMVGGRSGLNELFARLDTAHILDVLSHTLEPRAFLAWTLMQINPRAAHFFAGDQEMDARFRTIVADTAPALYCHPPKGATGGDPGFFANTMLLQPVAWGQVDPHKALRKLKTPALVVKGQCDYLSWSSAVDYRDTLADAALVYIPGAGHRVYAERPTLFFEIVEAFLGGRPLPVPVVKAFQPPPGYEGPATPD